MTEIERRAVEQPVELRAAPDGSTSPGILTGYACVFNQLSRDLGGWFEQIDTECFDLATNGRVLARLNHDSNGLLGTTDANTLRLSADDIGVLYEIDLPNTTTGQDCAELARRRDLAFSSFAFRPLPDGSMWMYGPNDELIRTITHAVLVDVAPVADPAYWGSTAELVRSFDLAAIKASLSPEREVRGMPAHLLHRKTLENAQPRI
jgi:HK97 family phage prohead protease